MRAPALTVGRARELRKKMTPPEVRLWVRLRARNDGEPVFRRQHPCGPYILDFYCSAAKLAVEVDGFCHALGDRAAHDARRRLYLSEQGIKVLRYQAADVLADADWIAGAIFDAARAEIGARPRSAERP